MNTPKKPLASLVTAALVVLYGCAPQHGQSESVHEGVILYAEYQMADGRTGGFTRLNDSRSVPGGNGSWNVDAYGKLTPDFLIVSRPQRADLGPQVIPAHRLVAVQFGDGGIKEVNESQSTPAK